MAAPISATAFITKSCSFASFNAGVIVADMGDPLWWLIWVPMLTPMPHWLQIVIIFR